MGAYGRGHGVVVALLAGPAVLVGASNARAQGAVADAVGPAPLVPLAPRADAPLLPLARRFSSPLTGALPAITPARSDPAATAVMVTGIVVTIAGAVMLPVGLAMTFSRSEPFRADREEGLQDHQKTGIGLLIGGAVGLGVGIPVIVVGKRMRADDEGADEAEEASNPFAFRF